jgi:7SK snRNA methylphosphate capping enzyme
MIGNYTTYYRNRRCDTDERFSILRKDFFLGKRCIDIGCNEGKVTLMIAKSYLPSTIVGIDADKRLIDTANAAVKRAKYAASNDPGQRQVAPARMMMLVPRSVVNKVPVVDSSTKLKSSVETPGIGRQCFPQNISFSCKDIMGFDSASSKYDTVLCLSVTKWIHLTEGDNGLLKLFRIMYQLTAVGGRLILEYQPWSSYLNRRRASEKTEAVFPTLQIRPESFEKILVEDIGFTIEERLGTPLSEAKGFNRPILVLLKGAEGFPVALSGSSSASPKLDEGTIAQDVINYKNGDATGVSQRAGQHAGSDPDYGESYEFEHVGGRKRLRISVPSIAAHNSSSTDIDTCQLARKKSNIAEG